MKRSKTKSGRALVRVRGEVLKRSKTKRDKVVQLVVIIAVPSPQTWGSLKVHYRLEEVPWPVLLAESSGG